MRRTGWVGLLLAVVLLAPATAKAQVAPESPFFLPPNAESGLGLFLLDTWRGGLGVVGIWRSPAWNWGLRLGLAEDTRRLGDDDLAIFGGVDFTGRVNRSTQDFPLDVDWLVGGFLSVGGDALISVPLGLTLGHTFRGQGASFTPYITPRMVLDAWFDDDNRGDGDDSDLDLDLAVDLGLDLRFTSNPNITIRFGATLGREAIGIGIVF